MGHFQKTVICGDQLQTISELQVCLSSENLQFDRSLIAKMTKIISVLALHETILMKQRVILYLNDEIKNLPHMSCCFLPGSAGQSSCFELIKAHLVFFGQSSLSSGQMTLIAASFVA